MATYSRVLLSGSTSGRPIPVAATATLGTAIHTAVAGSTSFDEVYLYANNTSGSAVTLTVEWGGAGTGNQIMTAYSIPANSANTPIVYGESMNGGLAITAFASVASVINIHGHVNRIV